MKRRTFLKIAGMGSLSFAAGCTSEPEKTLYALIEAPDDMVTGKASWYASTCRECPAGCGVLVKNREGRVIKVEGNPLHPINRGKLCMRGQAALQGVYNPDRINTPLLREKNGWRPLSFPAAEALLKDRALKAARNGED
jgi:molybdopterin-containing oxidoreductase family iron-sulfur binding subunit